MVASKLMVEQALEACQKAHGMDTVCMRNFNAAGADIDGELGEGIFLKPTLSL